ncbi:MAG: hypothetical protein ACE5EM_12470 [Sphingomonadales bacterium]
MSRFNIAREFDLIEKYAHRIGYSVDSYFSDCGTSRYLYTSSDDCYFKVRVADHSLPPTHTILRGRADFEVGPHQEASGDWLDCILWLARQSGAELPASIRRQVTRRANDAAKYEAKIAAMIAAKKEQISRELADAEAQWLAALEFCSNSGHTAHQILADRFDELTARLRQKVQTECGAVVNAVAGKARKRVSRRLAKVKKHIIAAAMR